LKSGERNDAAGNPAQKCVVVVCVTAKSRKQHHGSNQLGKYDAQINEQAAHTPRST
jgi:hypothetical protein